MICFDIRPLNISYIEDASIVAEGFGRIRAISSEVGRNHFMVQIRFYSI
jgi:hypothetical protein